MSEKLLNDKSFLVSQTDAKGKIIYVNDEFCQISEFTKEELLGKPHNIVRHPDMPKEMFKKLWDTIQAGKVWHGTMKNKTKSGHYFEVFSTVYPYKDENGNQCYLSCKRKPFH